MIEARPETGGTDKEFDPGSFGAGRGSPFHSVSIKFSYILFTNNILNIKET